MNRKAQFKTMEVFIAAVISIVIITFFLSQNIYREEKGEERILDWLGEKESFRNCVLTENISCLRAEVDQALPEKYEYQIKIQEPGTGEKIRFNQTKKIITESYTVFTNKINYQIKEINIGYWKKS